MKKCTLGAFAVIAKCEHSRGCEHCGWNKDEAARRKALLDKNWLTPCKDGLLRLILPKEESGADNE